MTIYGWDLSHYDSVPSGARVVSEGFSFMTHKAGGDANDAELGSWWNSVKGVRDQCLLGAYWVLYPGSGASRADSFLARLDSQCPGWRDGPFILQADCEKWGGDSSTVPNKADIKAFCDRLMARMPKLRPIVYAPKWVYGDSLTGLGYPLWASAYVTGTGSASSLYPGDSSSRWGTYSGQTPEILQFTSSATIAGQTTCDANAYRGTLQQLTALVAPGWAAAMATLDADDLSAIANKVWAIGNTYALRGGPATWGGTLQAIANYAVAEAGVPSQLAALTETVDSLAETVSAAVIAALPTGEGTLTEAQIQAAAKAGVEAAFAQAFGTAGS